MLIPLRRNYKKLEEEVGLLVLSLLCVCVCVYLLVCVCVYSGVCNLYINVKLFHQLLWVSYVNFGFFLMRVTGL